MSVSVSIDFRRKNTDQDHLAKVRAVEALKAAEVDELPKQLADYFGIKYPEELDEVDTAETVHMRYFEARQLTERLRSAVTMDEHQNLLIDLDALPPDIRVIRVNWG